MRCEQARADLSLAADGELAGGRDAPLAAHLAGQTHAAINDVVR